jgi:hypothetical protein
MQTCLLTTWVQRWWCGCYRVDLDGSYKWYQSFLKSGTRRLWLVGLDISYKWDQTVMTSGTRRFLQVGPDSYDKWDHLIADKCIPHIVTPRPPRDRACYPWQLSSLSRLSPQTNTSLSCALCPHSCAPGNNFPIGHPSSNRSRLSMLNPEFFSDELLEKKVYLVDMSILSILLSPRPGCHTLTP